MRHTFKAYERLKREQHIDTLFRKGKAFSVFPLKIVLLRLARSENERSPVRVGFSIPKRKFKKAVARNRIKRMMREAWRLHKPELYQTIPAETQLHLFLIFTGSEIPVFSIIEQSMKKTVAQLAQQSEP